MTHAYCIFNTWKNPFYYLQNVYGINKTGQRAELLEPKPSAPKDNIVTKNLKIYKSLGNDHINHNQSKQEVKYYILKSITSILIEILKNCHNSANSISL
jgi:hypothetical protein